MIDAFTSVQNHNEVLVFVAVADLAPHYPLLAGDEELLADVACVALNRLAPRYIRHIVDMRFYQTDHDRAEHTRSVNEAVRLAFEFVQAREAMGARGRVATGPTSVGRGGSARSGS